MGCGGRTYRFKPEIAVIAVSVDGKYFFTGSMNGTANLWGIETGEVLQGSRRPPSDPDEYHSARKIKLSEYGN